MLIQLFRYADNFKIRIYKASLYSILNKIFDLAPPVLIGVAVDTVVKGQESWVSLYLGVVDRFNQLLVIAFATIVIWVLESFFEYLFAVAWRELAQDIQHRLRMDCYSHLQQLDHSFYEDQSSGNLIAIVNDDINQLERFFDVGMNEILQVITTVIIIGGIYFIQDPFLAFLSFITMPFIVWGSIWFQGFLAPKYRVVRDQVGLLTGELNNNLQGMGTIKSFAREQEDFQKVEKFSLNYVKANQDAIKVSALFTPLIRMLVMIGFLMTLVVGGKLALEGKIEVGTYSVLVFLIQRLLWPLTRLGQTLDLFQRAMASSARAFSLLETKPKIVSGPIRTNKISGQIEFHDVSFSYSDGIPVLKNLNLSINPGESLGLVGGTGAGKSTLIKLLQRFYTPTSGHISLEGRDLSEYDLTSLRRSIAIVSQDVYLFHGSVRDNIRFANPDASNADIEWACQQACALEFIEALPQGFDTLVGERGQKLSGGQKQRLSIARALVANSPIVILDEATSAVDNVTEASLQQNLEEILKDKTTIVIAHRLSTVIHCDRIVVMEHGQISQSGGHEQLLSSPGLYHDLWNVQTGV